MVSKMFITEVKAHFACVEHFLRYICTVRIKPSFHQLFDVRSGPASNVESNTAFQIRNFVKHCKSVFHIPCENPVEWMALICIKLFLPLFGLVKVLPHTLLLYVRIHGLSSSLSSGWVYVVRIHGQSFYL